MTNSIYRVLALTLLMILTITTGYSQQAVTRIEGFIRDESTGKPVSVKLHVFNAQGKRVQTLTSNSKDGSYLVLLNEEGTYRFALSGHSIIRKEETVMVPPSKSFAEIMRDFKVKTVSQGEKLGSTRGFELNSANLNPEGKKLMDQIAELLKSNGELNVIISVLPDEDQNHKKIIALQSEYKQQHAAWQKAVKKVKKGKEPPPEPLPPAELPDPNPDLTRQRAATISNMLQDARNADVRVTVRELPLPQPAVVTIETPQVPPKSSKSKGKATPKDVAPPSPVYNHPTLLVEIGIVKKLYDH